MDVQASNLTKQHGASCHSCSLRQHHKSTPRMVMVPIHTRALSSSKVFRPRCPHNSPIVFSKTTTRKDITQLSNCSRSWMGLIVGVSSVGHQTQPYTSDSAMESPVRLAAIPDALAPTEQSQSQLPITDMNLHLACQQQAGSGFIPLELPSHQAQVLQQEAALQEVVHFITPNILCVPEPHAELILQALDIHIPVAQQRQSVWAHHI